MEVSVNPVAREKLAMGAGLYDVTALDHADAVRMRHVLRRWAMTSVVRPAQKCARRPGWRV